MVDIVPDVTIALAAAGGYLLFVAVVGPVVHFFSRR
jgi:hypothetical protein